MNYHESLLSIEALDLAKGIFITVTNFCKRQKFIQKDQHISIRQKFIQKDQHISIRQKDS